MSVSKEDTLLLNCSRITPQESNLAAAAELLQGSVDWDYIIQSSIRHGVAPLLRNAIRQIPPPLKQVPARVVERLEDLHQTSGRRNQRLYRIIGDIVREFDKAGIPVMGLKDVHLARAVYPDPALRPMGDIDLLIHPEDYEKAADCMFRLGFEREPFDKVPYILKYAWGHHFRRPRDNTYVDLQWNVMQMEWDVYQEGSFDFEIERMWKNAAKLGVDDYSILVPRLEDMLFHLCVHLDGHHFSELILLCDIHELIRINHSRMDWRYFVQMVNKYKAESFTYYSLRLVEHLFQIELPEEVLTAIRPAYFQSSFLANLFGNLSRLHYELDDLRETVSATPKTLQSLEVVARQQAVSAMRAYKEINQMLRAFKAQGGSYVCVQGSPSERVFADSSLSAFNEYDVLVLEDELPVMRKILLLEGFQYTREPGFDILAKNIVFQSADPVLEQSPIKLVIESKEIREGKLLPHPVAPKTTRQLAVKLLKSKFTRQNRRAADSVIRLNIIPLDQAQFLMYFCHRVSRNENGRLFELVTAMDFLETRPSSLPPWENARALSGQSGTADVFETGRSLIMDLFRAGRARLPGENGSTHIFEWARIGPDSTESFTRFKRPFNYFRTLLSIDSGKDRVLYWMRSFQPQNKHAPLVVQVFLDLAAGVLQFFRKSPPPVLAYWAVPESDDGLEKQRQP